MLSLEYIFHDGFLLEADGIGSFLFDYWKDGYEFSYRNHDMPGCLERLDKNIPLYIFISHHHKDHFNQHLFRWTTEFSKCTFFVSNDVRKFARHLVEIPSNRERTQILHRNEGWENNEIEVKAYGSTDIGNSYYVRLKKYGITIFHAGDLNNWTWLDESTDGEIRQMEGNYLKILQDIRKDLDHLTIAMFPVDSRIGREYWRGAYQFLDYFTVDHFFPMHFELGENAEEINRLHSDARQFRVFAEKISGDYIALQSPGDTWAIPINNR